MATIDTIDTWIVDVPTIRPHVLSMTSISRQSMVLVRVRCSDGVSGLGEGTTIGGLAYGDESPESIKLTIDTYFAPLLVGADSTMPAALMTRLRQNVVGNHFAKNAVETALLDCIARRAGVPLSDLLGGRQHDRLPVLWTLASGNTAQDIAEAEAMIEARRHNVFKLKIGKRPLADDVAHAGAIKRALGASASVRVDVNQAWDEQTARKGARMLADAGIDLIEQPLPRADRAGMARLAASAPIAIMADEALRGTHDAFDLAAIRAGDAFSIKAAQAGGLIAAGKVAAIAEAAHIGLYGGTMLEGSVGTAAAAHLCSTFATLAWGTELFGPLLQTEEILATPLEYADFALTVPKGPGLGIELDEDKVRHFRRDAPERTVVMLNQVAR
ncbi:muconate/chloromuconate family cycloisomerase [Novosphingobium sp. LASN5T]|uniref:muconate/chloromuconate family cycloisomerase n=1 Tax=Novosphingobium sp. LASN5T TaxID=2491021 RepID=UPI000F5FB74B|nr:muconate/chloromuconate family cycloisomerase [Novosphingobium sp. LASN5T]RQW44749.1 muconate cycloisomerase [Novosphingobium sp. LASN5T]